MLKFILFALRKSGRSNRQRYQPVTNACSQSTAYPLAKKTKAQCGASIKSQIKDLPSARVKWVVDGDTVIVEKGRNEITIRLDSIDCPEDGQYWGDIAKYGLMKLIARRDVLIEEHGMDGHGRTLATLYVWDVDKNYWQNVNERMVVLGHAWVMRMFYDHLPPDRQEKLIRSEKWARSKGVGLWHQSDPIPPWTWRKGDIGGEGGI